MVACVEEGVSFSEQNPSFRGVELAQENETAIEPSVQCVYKGGIRLTPGFKACQLRAGYSARCLTSYFSSCLDVCPTCWYLGIARVASGLQNYHLLCVDRTLPRFNFFQAIWEIPVVLRMQ